MIAADYLKACETLYWIRPRSTVDPETGDERESEGGLQPFLLFPEQRRTSEVLLEQRRQNQPCRVVKVKPRQSGDSTHAASWTFHNTYWGRNRRGLTVAHHDTTTASLYQMHQTFYAELPPELQLPLEKLNRKELATKRPHSNSLIAQTAGFLDIGHGLTIQDAHLSEIDLWVDPETALEGIMETVPLAPGTSIFIESKAQGVDGWLYTFWKNSKRGLTGFTPLFTTWYQVPEYRMPVPRDFEPTEEERAWIAEFKITGAQVMWYRTKRNLMIAKEPWGGDRRMKSSYPFTDDEAFQTSGVCVFPDTVLARLKAGCQGPEHTYRLESLPFPGQFTLLDVDPNPKHPQLWVWEKPRPECFYALGVDISDGVGETESVVSVCKYPGYEQVAEWASNRSSVEETAYVGRWLAEWYGGGNTVLVPEINRNGSLILYLLFNLPGNYAIFRWRYLDRPGLEANDNPKLGWETNGLTKKALVQVANMVFLRGQGWIRSDILHEQMTRCLDILPGQRWKAMGGRSDRIIAWLIAMMGTFLDFEGGSVGHIVSARKDTGLPEADPNWREPNRYDTRVDEVFADHAMPVGSAFLRSDLEG